jgi:hypothetical protein
VLIPDEGEHVCDGPVDEDSGFDGRHPADYSSHRRWTRVSPALGRTRQSKIAEA